MVLPFRSIMFVLALIAGVATSYSVFAEPIYDVLDGTGPSHKKVDVVEWEGNLEVHVYPKGSAAGLGVKLDDRTQGKKVMVIAYRFKGQKDVLVRRAILGVPFDPKLKGFVDPTEKDFDKLAISNQQMPAPWKPYKFDPAPKQWYPDGDERNDEDPAAPAVAPVLGETQKSMSRTPASAADSAVDPDSGARTPATKKIRRSDDGSLNQYNW